MEEVGKMFSKMILEDIMKTEKESEKVTVKVDLNLLNKLNNLKEEDIVVEDWGGISPRQVMFHLKDKTEIGYLRVRYGSATLYVSTFELEGADVKFGINYFEPIYWSDFGGFGDGDFVDEKHKDRVIEICLIKMLEFYHTYDTKELIYYKKK